MATRSIDPADKAQRETFIALEHRFIAGEPLHISEFDADLRKRFTRRVPAMEPMDFALFVADGEAARCGAFINRRYQEHHNEQVGFIGYFAVAPNAPDKPVREMIETAEAWLAERGVTRVIAPHNGFAFHGMALLTDAFDESPMFPMGWTPKHWVPHLEAAGYAPTYPLWIYDVDLRSDTYRARAKAALERGSARLRPVDKKRWESEMDTLRLLFNDAFSTHWEFHPMTQAEWMELWGQMKQVVEPQQMQFAEVDGRAVGFCFGMPDLTDLFRSLGGKLGPLQILKLMRGAKRYARGGILGIGVDDSQRGKGIAAQLAAHVFEVYARKGFASAPYYPVNDDNAASRALAGSFGGRGRPLYHGFDRAL